MTDWIKTEDMLPPYGKYVLARHNRGSWVDREDQDNVNCVVVKLVKGRTHDEVWAQDPVVLKFADQEGNNQRPYAWDEFGPDSYFGQDITHWMVIPPLEDL